MPIVNVDVNSAPTFTHDHVYLSEVGLPFSINLISEDSEGDKVSISSAYLPSWLTQIETADGLIALSGTPEARNVGVNFFSVKATDGQLSREEHYAVLVGNFSSDQTSAFSLFGQDISKLTIHTTPSIPMGGVEQPYSSVDLLFNLASADSSNSADRFTIETEQSTPSGIILEYTPVDQYAGVISLRGSLSEGETHENNITLSAGNERYDFNLSILSTSSTTGRITSVMDETSFYTASFSGKALFVNGVEDDAIIIDERGLINLTTLDLSSPIRLEVDLEDSIQPVDIADVIYQLKGIVGLSELSATQKIAADVSGDGTLTISDLIANLKLVIGLTSPPRAQLINQDLAAEYTLEHGLIHDFTLIFPGDVNGSLSELI